MRKDLDFTNTGLIHEEILLDIILVLEYGWPAGPKFLHALSALTEALVIHDVVYFDPLNYTARNDLHKNEVPAIINGSRFVEELTKSNALTALPDTSVIDDYLTGIGSSYNTTEFLIDSTYERISFASAVPDGEQERYENLIDLMEIPQVLSCQDSPSFPVDGIVEFKDPSILAAMNYGFNYEDLRKIVALNKRAAAYLQLAKTLGMNLYPTYVAVPHQIGAVKLQNSKAREIYEAIEAKVISLDDEPVGNNEYSRIQIPPLLQTALLNCKDSTNALPLEILKLRHHHRRFRDYLTGYERSWNSANTRQERSALRREFQNSWDALIKNIETPTTRIVYTLWDVFKSPLSWTLSI